MSAYCTAGLIGRYFGNNNNNNTNNNNERIYVVQNKQSSDALTRTTKQASFQVSGKRRHSQ